MWRGRSGGIPLIWPQFSNRGPLASHGFARVSDWRVTSKDDARLVLELEDSEATRKLWPFEFIARYSVELLPNSLRLHFEGARVCVCVVLCRVGSALLNA